MFHLRFKNAMHSKLVRPEENRECRGNNQQPVNAAAARPLRDFDILYSQQISCFKE